MRPLTQCGWSADRLTVETSDGRNCDIAKQISYTALDGTKYDLTPADTTDGASSPSFVWDVIPPFGWYWPPAVLHDHLYRRTALPKSVCDGLLKEAMNRRAETDEQKAQAWEIYEAVVLAGQSAFNSDRRIA